MASGFRALATRRSTCALSTLMVSCIVIASPCPSSRQDCLLQVKCSCPATAQTALPIGEEPGSCTAAASHHATSLVMVRYTFVEIRMTAACSPARPIYGNGGHMQAAQGNSSGKITEPCEVGSLGSSEPVQVFTARPRDVWRAFVVVMAESIAQQLRLPVQQRSWGGACFRNPNQGPSQLFHPWDG